MRRLPPALLLLLSLACGARDGEAHEPLTAEREDEAGTSRAEHEARAAGGTTSAAEGTPPAATGPAVTTPEPVAAIPRELLTLSRLDGSVPAEDGAGNVVASERAVAFDLDASRFPPRALDPVLTVGALRFTHYRHPAIGILRFVVASPELLVDGAEVAVQYGEASETRTLVAASLSVPAEVRR